MINPYEFVQDRVGVQARVLYAGKKGVIETFAHSLQLLSYDAFYYRVKNESVRKLRNQGPNSPMLVLWDSLPEAWQQLLVKTFGEPSKKIVSSLFEREYIKDTKALEFYLNWSPEPGKYLTTEQVEEYTLNASVLNLVERMAQKRSDYRVSLKGTAKSKEIRQSIANDTARFKAVKPHTLPEHPDNLFKDLHHYKKVGYGYLISGRIGNQSARKVTDTVEKLLNDLFAGRESKPSYEDVVRDYDAFLLGYIQVINSETGEEYSPSGFPVIKRTTIQNYLSKWRNKIGNEAIRSGDRQKLRGKFIPYHSLEKPKYAGSIISVDDRQPPFEYDKGSRMWFYLGADIASTAIVTWVWGKDKKGLILDFYRQMVRLHHHYGVSLPFELEAESNLNSDLSKTLLAEGAMFEKVRIEANNARGKWIESGINRQLRYKNEKDKDGWIGRPFARSEANQQGAGELPIIPYDKLVQARLADIEDWNNEPHPLKPEVSRFEYWLENQHPALKPINYRGILPFIGWSTQTSVNAGLIRLNNTEFMLGIEGELVFGERLTALMDIVEAEQIKIYWLDDLEGNVMKALVYMNDEYVCDAIAKPKYNKATIEQTPEDLLRREAMSKYVATIEAYMHRKTKAVDPVMIINNRPKPKRTFVMPGLERYEAPIEEGEVMPPAEESEEFVTIETTPKRSLKDRF